MESTKTAAGDNQHESGARSTIAASGAGSDVASVTPVQRIPPPKQPPASAPVNGPPKSDAPPEPVHAPQQGARRKWFLLAAVILVLELGDETDAPRIVELIVERRAEKPIATTEELCAIVCEARDFTLKRAAGAKLHPAARTFQALRILVNREMANLERLLTVLPDCLAPGGVAVIISFHSGEDRRVKKSFREGLRAGIYSQISPDPIVADEAEQKLNPRARSAKLRWARSRAETRRHA